MHPLSEMKKFLFIIVAALSLSGQAQVTESFTDGNFTSNPVWTGDDSLFVVNGANQLQTNGTGSNIAILSSGQSLLMNTVWEVWVRFNFSPSTQNFCRFYLSNDSSKLNGNGYYVQLGGSIGNSDSISLYKQIGSQRARVIGGRPSTVYLSNSLVRIKVTRDAAGLWQLYSDTSGGTNYTLEGSGNDKDFTSSTYCGAYCKYTSSNAKNFYFDDIDIRSGIDTTKPKLITVAVISNTQLELDFSEPVDTTTAENSNSYLVNNGIGKPSAATLAAGNAQKVVLDFSNVFTSGGGYQLSVSGVQDLAANTIVTVIRSFTNNFGLITPILINEIMADPSPKVGLPDFEFVELYNPGSKPVDISNWTFGDGSSTATITNGFGNPIIPPDSFIILCSPTALSQFSAYGNVAVLSGFPSLNNSGDNLTLKDNFGQVVNTLNYSDQWYSSSTKVQGGWSLEMINPGSNCGGKANWKASIDADGGTPGTRNSVYTQIGDVTAPKILSFWYEDSITIKLVTDEPLKVSSLNISNVSINNSAVVSGIICNADLDSFTITLSQSMKQGNGYGIKFANAADCEGNKDTLRFYINYLELKQAGHLDVVFSEVYSIPQPNTPLPNVEWVELHNLLADPVKIVGWNYADASSSASIPPTVIPPNGFVILCHKTFAPQMQPYGQVVGLPSFPSLNNDVDQLYIFNEKGQAIHSLRYSVDWYASSFKKNGGWSLELIDAGNPCSGTGNWKACVDSKGGTPGMKNSIQAANPDRSRPEALRAYPIDNKSIKVYFSEEVDSIEAINSANYSLTQPSVSPISAHSDGGDLSVFVLGFADSFQIGKIYELNIFNLFDCSGNPLTKLPIQFGLPQPVDTHDIAINELLFNPVTDGIDFMEIYNRSSKVLDLAVIRIANVDDHGQLNNVVPLSSYLLLPSTYLCLSSNQRIVKGFYTAKDPKAFLDVESFPSYNDDEGAAVIIGPGAFEIERFAFSQNMHYALLDNKDGVSLERVDFNRSILESTNWQSAASGVGYGTPGYQNSQYIGAANGNDALSLSPESFSPDGDGYNDVMNINYAMPEAGYEGALTIFDGNGNIIRKLTGRQLLGLNGAYTWNGLTEEGNLATAGVYIVWFEYFNLKGTVKHARKTCVVAVKQ